MARPALEIADIFRDYGPAWRKANAGHVSLGQLKVMSAIESCRTVALGGHVMRCEDCLHTQIAYNSCRNRHCPKCQGSQALAWIKQRKSELLGVPYFHVVFTLPGRIGTIAYQNKAIVYDLLFKASSQTMRTIAADPKRLGVKIGFTSVLHTWGSAMTHHPHVHMIVPGGGISLDGTRWIGCRPNFLLPVKVLSRLFRRLMLQMLLAAHDTGRLQFFGDHAHLAGKAAFKAYLAPLHRTKWFVYSKRPFAGPEQVLAYLSRYTHRVAISNSRLIAADATGITFSYKDYRIEGPGRYKTMTLKPDEFIRRFLIHVLPCGFHRIRHCGLLASGTKTETIARARQLIAAVAPVQTVHQQQPPDSAAATDQATHPCPCCGGRMNIIETFSPAPHRNTDRRRQPRSGSIRHDHVPHLTDPQARSSSPALDPQRQRSCKSAFATSTSPSIFLAYRRFPHRRPISHAPQRRQPTRSSASVALTQLRRAQTSIALGARGATACHFPRVPSLKAFGRRPLCMSRRCRWPASETLNKVRSPGVQPAGRLYPQLRTQPCTAQTDALWQNRKWDVHSITSSAVASSAAGTARPSALATLRLITNSYFVGA